MILVVHDIHSSLSYSKSRNITFGYLHCCCMFLSSLFWSHWRMSLRYGAIITLMEVVITSTNKKTVNPIFSLERLEENTFSFWWWKFIATDLLSQLERYHWLMIHCRWSSVYAFFCLQIGYIWDYRTWQNLL